MKLGLVVNNVLTEMSDYTTTLIAQTAISCGHEVWYIDIDKLSYTGDGNVYAHARKPPKTSYSTREKLLQALNGEQAILAFVDVGQLDVLWLRNDPAEDITQRPWARLAGINFGRMAMQHGVLVLNDPNGLNQAVNKMYLQYFPEEVRPRAIITRDPDDIKHFIRQEGGQAVLKPLAGSGGRNVFLINAAEEVNLNQIIESICHEGYIIAQEYLPEAEHGDIRMFLMNGRPLTYKNRIAAVHRTRLPGDDDIRSNMTAGAQCIKAEITPEMLEVAEIVRPRLVMDGMFFVGLDIVGNKLMEINVFSPGGMIGAERLEKAKFCRQIIHSLEKKVKYMRYYERHFDNAEIATL